MIFYVLLASLSVLKPFCQARNYLEQNRLTQEAKESLFERMVEFVMSKHLTVWFMTGLAGRSWPAFAGVWKGFRLWILFKDTYQRELHNDFKQKEKFRADPSLDENRFSLTLWLFWKIKIYNLRITDPIQDGYLIESCADNLFITAQCVVIYGQRG